jgi:hypothetical protein
VVLFHLRRPTPQIENPTIHSDGAEKKENDKYAAPKMMQLSKSMPTPRNLLNQSQ